MPKIALLMGSQSDWPTLQSAATLLDHFHVSYHAEIISAHRTPDKLMTFAQTAHQQGIDIIIAGAGGAAHLPGMLAAHTHVPVLGVPVQSKALNGLDSLLSIVQMPRGVAVGTLAIGEAGAINAALLAVQILALNDDALREQLLAYRQQQTQTVLDNATPKAAP